MNSDYEWQQLSAEAGGLHAQQADQDYRERWVDNPLLVCTYLQPKKDEETALFVTKII